MHANVSVPAWPPSSGVVAVPGSRLACAGRAGDHTDLTVPVDDTHTASIEAVAVIRAGFVAAHGDVARRAAGFAAAIDRLLDGMPAARDLADRPTEQRHPE